MKINYGKDEVKFQNHLEDNELQIKELRQSLTETVKVLQMKEKEIKQADEILNSNTDELEQYENKLEQANIEIEKLRNDVKLLRAQLHR